MKTTMLIAAAALALTGMGTARADDDCESRIGDWQPRSAVVKMAEERGWTVQRIKTDDGCYEILCTDAEGRMFRVIVDPATLKVVATETRTATAGGSAKAMSDPTAPAAATGGTAADATVKTTTTMMTKAGPPRL